MREERVGVRGAALLVGILTLLPAVALTAGTTHATEATWNDTVVGSSVFGIADAGPNRARATSAYGSMTYQNGGQANFPKVEVLGDSQVPPTGAAIGPITREVRGSNIPATVDGTVCIRTTSPGTSCSLDSASGTSAFAQATASDLRISRGNGFTLVRYGDGQRSTAATATAACRPGELGVAGLTAGGPVVLGNQNNTVDVPLPAPNTDTVTQSTAGTTTFTVRFQRVEKVALGYARSELRLRVSADSASDDPWVLHLILASAECGLAQPIEQALPQPTATNFPALPGGVLSRSAAAVPTLVDDDEPVAETLDPAEDEQAVPDTGATTSADATEPTEPTEATAPDDSTAGPQQPESVRPGRWFTVTSRAGVELGSARIEDIVRTSGCGIELHLSIVTSAETGPDRWSSIGPDDFAEALPDGTTLDARPVGSDCGQSATSPSTAQPSTQSPATSLLPGRDHEIVITIQLQDSAQQAMLRPEGTAGWIFDLPPLPTTPETSPSATSAATADPGA